MFSCLLCRPFNIMSDLHGTLTLTFTICHPTTAAVIAAATAFPELDRTCPESTSPDKA